MAKRRDSGSGRYISLEEAEGKSKDTWTEEATKSFKVKDSERQHLLRSLYEGIASHADPYGGIGSEVVSLNHIKEIFKAAGLKFED